jgi:hypothetical protein
MHKFITTITTIALAFNLSGCDESLLPKKQASEADASATIEEPKFDAYSFTKKFDSREQPAPLNTLQQKTVDQIIGAYDAFLAETKEENYPTINAYAKKHDWVVNYYKDESYTQYKTKLNDGSGVSILFEHVDIKKYDIKEHVIYAWQLKEAQCNYLVKHYNHHEKIKVEVVRYTHNPEGTSTQDSSCEELSKEKGYDIAVKLKYTGKNFGKEYALLDKQLPKLFNKDYSEVSEYENIYFTKEPVSYKYFRDGVGFAINKANNHITISDITKIRCKEIIYDLPSNINYKINGGNECSKDINTIEFYQ